jgi:hypothetical protein
MAFVERARKVVFRANMFLLVIGLVLLSVGAWAATDGRRSSPSNLLLAASQRWLSSTIDYAIANFGLGFFLLGIGSLGALVLCEEMARGFMSEGRLGLLIIFLLLGIASIILSITILTSASLTLADLNGKLSATTTDAGPVRTFLAIMISTSTVAVISTIATSTVSSQSVVDELLSSRT